MVCSIAGYAVKCYECNSYWKYEGKPCDDPIDTSKIELVDCDQKYGTSLGANYTMCRKMHQNGKVLPTELISQLESKKYQFGACSTCQLEFAPSACWTQQ